MPIALQEQHRSRINTGQQSLARSFLPAPYENPYSQPYDPNSFHTTPQFGDKFFPTRAVTLKKLVESITNEQNPRFSARRLDATRRKQMEWTNGVVITERFQETGETSEATIIETYVDQNGLIRRIDTRRPEGSKLPNTRLLYNYQEGESEKRKFFALKEITVGTVSRESQRFIPNVQTVCELDAQGDPLLEGVSVKATQTYFDGSEELAQLFLKRYGEKRLLGIRGKDGFQPDLHVADKVNTLRRILQETSRPDIHIEEDIDNKKLIITRQAPDVVTLRNWGIYLNTWQYELEYIPLEIGERLQVTGYTWHVGERAGLHEVRQDIYDDPSRYHYTYRLDGTPQEELLHNVSQE